MTDFPNAKASPASAIRWSDIGQGVCLVVLTCLCYWPSLNGGFLWDDDLCILHSPVARSLDGLRQIWGSTVPYDYYPLTYTTFWIEWHLWGVDPLGYRVVNLALHLVGAGLLWRLLKVLGGARCLAGRAALCYSSVNVASVAWIAERKNTLSMVFYLGSLLAYVRSGDSENGWHRRWYGVALGCFVLAVLSKSSVVMLPCVLLLLVWWQRGRIRGVDLAQSAPFFLVSLLAGLATVWFQRHRAMDVHVASAVDPLAWRTLEIPHVILFYLGKTFVPIHLSMIYPRWVPSFQSPATYGRILAVVTLGFVVWKLRLVSRRGLPAALGYFLLTILPVAGLIPTTFLTYSYVSDHYVYVAMIGLLAALAAGLTIWRARPGWSLVADVAAVSLTGWFVCSSFVRAGEFASSERLWQSTLVVNPRCAVAHNNLGLALEEARQPLAAETHFRAALALEPRLPAAATNLAGLLQGEGRWQEAAAAYVSALADFPDPKDYNNYGVVCLQLGDTAGARVQFQRAAALESRMLSPHFNLYKVAASQHDPATEADELGECLRRDPDDVPSLRALAVLDIQAGAPGVIPVAALVLTRRSARCAGTLDPLSAAILSRADHQPPDPRTDARMPEIIKKIDACVQRLPTLSTAGTDS